ncbi:type II CRISPR-associated endonuclease Cas1 [Eggerthellaceae bacterium 3-80]|nr:type II CRISPR-associated endonuclease Cas1 [bacterium D16-34]
MSNNWRTVDLTRLSGRISFSKNTRFLDILDDLTGEIISIAPCEINVLFIGIKVQLEPAVMYHLANQGVITVFTDWKGLPISGVYPWVDPHGRVAARQRAQSELSLPKKKNAWKNIVKAKVFGQANVIERVDLTVADKLRSMAQSVKSGDPENIEAQAARLYWHNLFGDKSFRRLPGLGEPGKNALLDYGYTILRGQSMRAIVSAGLIPTLGIFHRGRGNQFALADDLIEPFRPVIDAAVLRIGDECCIEDKEVRRLLIEATLEKFGTLDSVVQTAMTDFAQQYGRFIEGDIERLSVPIWGSHDQ